MNEEFTNNCECGIPKKEIFEQKRKFKKAKYLQVLDEQKYF